MNKKQIKNQIINLRVTTEQKEEIRKRAESLGLTVSDYIIGSLGKTSINVVDGGKELAKEVYRLNRNLEHYQKYPFIRVQELQDTVSHGIQKLNNLMKEGF